MVPQEKREFQIKLKVKEKNGKIQELNKKESLEITWEDNKGILNPGERKYYDDKYGKGSYRTSEGQKIRFEKDGKNYDIVVKINEIKKGWFKDRIVEFAGFYPVPGSDFTIAEEEKPRSPQESNGRMSENWEIKPTQFRKEGFVLLGIIFLVLLVVVSLIIYFQEKQIR